MSEQPPITVGDVLERVGLGDYKAKDDAPIPPEERVDRWYVSALLGCGGWLAALFFFACFGIFLFTFLLASEAPLTLSGLGVVLIGSSLFLHYAVRNVFFSQLALALHLAGELLWYLGWVDLIEPGLDEYLVIGLVLLITQVIIVPLYNNPAYRAVGALLGILGLFLIVIDLVIPGSLSLLIALVATTIFLIWGGLLPDRVQVRYYDFLRSVGTALVTALLGLIVAQLAYGEFVRLAVLDDPFYRYAPLYTPLVTSVFLLLLVLWAVIRELRVYGSTLTDRAGTIALIAIIIITLPTLTTPGILAGILLLILAFRQRQRVLMVYAYIFMTVFIIYFYYVLNITLLVKSFILMLTGVLFLGARFVYRARVPLADDSAVG
jgi:uncharacterized membrane protein